MNKDEVEAHSLFNNMQKQQALLAEFEKLGPNWKKSVFRLVSMLLGMAFLIYLHPDIAQQPVLYVFLILVFGISAELHAESKRINKRIDVLHKLLKDDV